MEYLEGVCLALGLRLQPFVPAVLGAWCALYDMCTVCHMSYSISVLIKSFFLAFKSSSEMTASTVYLIGGQAYIVNHSPSAGFAVN